MHRLIALFESPYILCCKFLYLWSNVHATLSIFSTPYQAEKVKGKGSRHPRLKKSSISASSLEDEDMKSASYAARRTKSGASKKSRDNKSKPSSTTTTSSTSSSKPSAADVSEGYTPALWTAQTVLHEMGEGFCKEYA